MSHNFGFGWAKRITTVMQAEDSECGLACVAMLLGHFGHHVSLQELRAASRSSSRGSSLRDMLDVADQLGMQLRPLRIELDELKAVRVPAILHLDGDHFVLLERLSRSKCVIHDPAKGRRSMARKELNERFTGVAVEALLTDRFVAKPKQGEQTLGFIRRLGRLKGFKTSFTAILLFSAVLELTALFGPLFLQMVIDSVLVTEDVSLLLIVCGSYFFLSLFQTVSTAFRAWAISVLGSSLNIGWLANVFRRLLRQPDRFFENRAIGDLTSRFSGLGHIQSAVSTEAISASLDGTLAIFTLLVLFFYSKEMALAVCVGSIIYLTLKVLSFRAIADANIDMIAQEARKETLFVDSVRAQSTLRLNNKQSFQVSRFMDAVVEFQKSTLKLTSIQLVFSSASSLVTASIKIVTIYLGAKLIMGGSFTAGMLIAFLAYCDQFTGRSSRLIDYAVNWKILRVYTDRLREIVDSEPEADVFRTRAPTPLDMTLRVAHVAFLYGANDRALLRNVNFELRPAEFVAITGSSGAGKSTIVRLLAGTVEPSHGKITLGGLQFDQLGKSRVRELVAFVAQDDEVLLGTIEENVSLFDDSVDSRLVRECCALASVSDEIERMPMQYQTLLGNGRTTISGGQRQRILIARALYRRPKILVLDEATSHLDLDSEGEVLRRIRSLGVSVLLVAHRPETVGFADRVLVLENGIMRELEASLTESA